MALQKIFKFRQCIFAILRYYLHLEKGRSSIGKTWFPIFKDALCQIEIAITILNSLYTRMLCAKLKLLQQSRITFTQGCFVPSVVEIGPVVQEKKTEILKVYDDNADNVVQRKTVIRRAPLSLRLRWAKMVGHDLYINADLRTLTKFHIFKNILIRGWKIYIVSKYIDDVNRVRNILFNERKFLSINLHSEKKMLLKNSNFEFLIALYRAGFTKLSCVRMNSERKH